MPDNKPTNRERLREITEGIEQGIKELFESEKYIRYLSVMSRFHRYSVNNTMLIYMQKPDATLVAGFNKWKNQFERHVKKGEHGITIIAPTPYKKKIEEQKLDPDTKAPILDKDGRIVTEEKEIEIPMFRPVKVFDLSQTDGKPLPELASNLSGNVQNFEVFMEALRRSAPVPIEFEPMDANMDGYFSSEQQRIAIRTGMSEVQTVSAAVHETAHSKLHNYNLPVVKDTSKYQEVELFDQPALFSNGRIAREDLPDGLFCYDLRGSDDDPGYPIAVEERVVVNHAASVITAKPLELPEDGRIMFTEESGLNFVGGEKTIQQFLQESKKDRHTEEVEAESISYAVCKYYGIETSENSFGYIASWSQGKELKELRSSLETISKTSGELISDIDRHYKEICKERGIDLTAEQERVSESEKTEGKEPALSTSNVQQETLTYYVAECMEFPSLGEYHENLSLMEAVELYQAIPAERMNGIKGIGFDLQDGSDYNGQFPILIGKTIDVETINGIDHFRNSPLVQKAVSDLIAAMPDMEVTQAAPPLAELGIDQKVMGNVAELLQVQPSQESVAFDINGEEFLAIQHCESGHDYTIYSPDFALLDGGQIDNHSLEQVTYELLMEEIKGTDLVRPYDYDTLMEQVEAAQQQQFEKNELGEVQSPSVSMLPESPEQALDEYPMPDPVLTQDDLEKCGYLDSDLLPLSKERAYELMERDLTVYIVQEGETPEMAFDTIDLDAHDGIFAVSREEWEQSPQFHEKVLDRQKHQQEREQAFLSHEGDCFAIYQVSREDPQNLRFMNLDWLQSHSLSVDRSNYDLIYTAPLNGSGSTMEQLERLYEQFNLQKPVDFHSPSMSVSDIVAIKQDGKVSCHYCDSFGFTDVPGFLSDNPMKNAEMTVEDDYGMIDGVINNGSREPTVAQLEQQARSGQPISLMDLAAATHREERDKKKSVMEQLKSQPRTEHKKKAPQKSAEREI